MKTFAVSAAVLLAGQGAVAQKSTNPVQKVVKLLDDFQEKVKQDGQDAEVAFAKGQQICATSQALHKKEIADGETAIEAVTSKIEKANADAGTAESRVSELEESISRVSTEIDSIKGKRTEDGKKAEDQIGELRDTVQTLGRASTLLVDRLESVKKGSLLEVKESAAADQEADKFQDFFSGLAKSQQTISSAMAEILLAKVKQLSVGPLRSNKIIDVIDDMKKTARANLEEVSLAESKAQHSHELMLKAYEQQISVAKDELVSQRASAVGAKESAASFKGDLDLSKTTVEETKKALKESELSCSTEASDRETAVETLKKELEALAEARAVLAEKTGATAAHLYGSLLSFKKRVPGETDMKVMNMIRDLAEKESSPQLNQLATQVESAMDSTSGDPMAKVKDLIGKMIARLKEESKKDQNHADYCEKEESETKKKVKKLQNKKDRMDAAVDSRQADKQNLADDLQRLKDNEVKLTSVQVKMDALRTEEKGIFSKTSKDLQEGLDAIRAATKVLKDFYGKGEASLLQQNAPKKKSAALVQNKAAPDGVFELLDVVESDTSKSIFQAQTAEDEKQSDYDKQTKENQIEKATIESSLKYKNKAMALADTRISSGTRDQDASKAELDAVLEYQAQLAETCKNKGETFEEKQAREKEQLEGLKEALEVLRTSASSMLEVKSSLRGNAFAADPDAWNF